MTRAGGAAEPIYSTLAEDPELMSIVESFVEEMPARASDLLDRMNAEDWEGVRRAAHQLKGAAGSYGFDPITPFAARVEDTIRESRPEEQIRESVEALVRVCRRARADSPF